MNQENKPQELTKKVEELRLRYEADKAELQRKIKDQGFKLVETTDKLRIQAKTIDQLTEELAEANREKFANRLLKEEQAQNKQSNEFLDLLHHKIQNKISQIKEK